MSFWGQRLNALLLLELLQTGEVPRRRAQHLAWEELLKLGWARRTRRQSVLALEMVARADVETTLRRSWPESLAVAARLSTKGLPPTPAGVSELERLDRMEAAHQIPLPGRLNRRTAAASVGRHAKARLGPFEHVSLEDVDLTNDGIVRMRPNVGLQLCKDGVFHDARQLATLLGEIVISDRALRDGTSLSGLTPRAVLTVENLGAYQDIVVPDDVLVVHVPGWNTLTTRDLLDGLNAVPVLHFGDLDPNGIAILLHLRRWRTRIRWFIPAYWKEHQETKGLAREWPEIEMPRDAPDWVRSLPHRGLWMEQEVVAIDQRFRHSLETEILAALSE